MTQHQGSGDKFSVLRSRAEETIGGKPSDMDDMSTMSPEDFQRLVHELRVYQIELEMQNEELRQSQIKMEALKDRYLDLYDFAPVGYITLNDKGVIQEANLTAARLLGAERQVLINTPFARFVSQEYGDAYYLHLRKVFETQSKQTCQIKLLRGDGSQFFAQQECISVNVENGQAQCRAIILDITERKLTEEIALQSARLKSVADLTSGVAHHFNNLLQMLIGGASLCLDDLESGELSEVRRFLEKMLKEAKNGAELVRRLQTFAEIRNGRSKCEGAIFDVSTTARHAAEYLKPLWTSVAETSGFKIDIHTETEDGCFVLGQENEIFEALVNLIRNAVEASPQGGKIKITTMKDAGEVVVSVQDMGTGISQENLKRMFEPLWSTKGMAIGKGMGLAVCHGLVKSHGGSISVQSKLGIGTTFSIKLPLATQAVKELPNLSLSLADVHLTILVIDDESHIVELMTRTFSRAGHKVYSALSGRDGLSIFEKESPDFVICDLGMPGMNGWDVGKSILTSCEQKAIRKPPFVLLTGWGGQELQEKMIVESGTDATIAKPIGPSELLQVIREIAVRLDAGYRRK